MTATVVLIADPAKAPLQPALVRAVAACVHADVRVLAEAEAVLLVADGDAASLQPRIEAIVEGQPVDAAVLDGPPRRRKLLQSDMDSTVITIECLDELADHAGRKAEVAAVTQRAMNGEIPYIQSLRDRVATLEGVAVSAIDEVCRERLRLMPGAKELVATMRRHGARTLLVSGGFKEFTAYVRGLTGFEDDVCNRLEIRDGKLTGRLLGAIVDGNRKREVLDEQLDRHGLDADDALAMGDGANDIPMLRAAGLGVAFRAHARVEDAVPVRIRHGDLTAALFLQGYARADFAS